MRPKLRHGTSCHVSPNRPQCAAIKKARNPGQTGMASGESMAADNSPSGNPAPNDVTVAVSNEALLKAESFVEQEEGAANRLMGWAGEVSTTIAVGVSLVHLYAAY